MLDIDFREHWKTILLVVAGIALIAFIISLIIGLSSNARRRTAEQEAQAAEAAALVPMSIIDELELRPEKLMISPGLEEFWRGITSRVILPVVSGVWKICAATSMIPGRSAVKVSAGLTGS
jgi:hypothetical protein